MRKVFRDRFTLCCFVLLLFNILILSSAPTLAGPPQPLQMKLPTTDVPINECVYFSVVGGTSPYTISFSNPNIAALRPSETKIDKAKASYAVEGKKFGTTLITVKDGRGAVKSSNLVVRRVRVPAMSSGVIYLTEEDLKGQKNQKPAPEKKQKPDEKERLRNQQQLQDQISKSEAEVRKSREKTARDINKQMQELLRH